MVRLGSSAGTLAVTMDLLADADLDPSQIYDPVTIRASDISIDGHGACLQGTSFEGAGINGRGVHGVRLRNLRVRGFRIGLVVEDARDWTIEDCDFSDNFDDPDFGWGDHAPAGGLLLSRSSGFAIRGCRSNRVWDACHLIDSDHNVIENNDFSHASNTCLKLWASSRNEVRGNNLSYG